MKSSQPNRNTQPGDSYEEIESHLKRSQFSSTKPRPEFEHELLRTLETGAFKKKTMPTSPFMRWMPAAFGFVAIMLVVSVLVVTLPFFGKPQGSVMTQNQTNEPLVLSDSVSENAFAMKAVDEEVTGIKPATSFELVSEIDMPIEKVSQNLALSSGSSSVQFAVEKTAEKVFRVTPKKPLPPDSIVTASMNVTLASADGATKSKQYSWAYQVQEQFQITSTLPRNRADGATLDSGIEVTFSHEGFTGAEKAFSVEPTTKGRFEIHKNTLSFVPERPLQPRTYYKVIIKKDVQLPKTGETLQNDFSFSFITTYSQEQYDDTPRIESFTQKTYESSPNDAPAFMVSGINIEQVKETTLTLYTFPDEKTFEKAWNDFHDIPAWASSPQNQWTMDTKSLKVHSSTKVKVQSFGFGQIFIEAPGKMEKGWYLVEVPTGEKGKVQAFLQVSNIVAYTTLSEKQTVVWTHNSDTGDVLSDADVLLNNQDILGKTNDKGLLSVSTPEKIFADIIDHPGTITIQKGKDVLFVPLTGGGIYLEGQLTPYSSTRVQPYWTYLYFDQPYYLSTDTVNFWGVVKHRENKPVATVKAQLVKPANWNTDRSVLAEKELSVDAYGSITGSFTFSNLLPDTAYDIELLVNDIKVIGKSVSVISFRKPAYEINASPENQGVIRGDSLTHEVKAQFFDKNPVAYTELKINDIENIKTDNQGVASYSKKYIGDGGEGITTEYLSFTPRAAEEGEIHGEARVKIFPSSRLIKLETSGDGKKGTVQGTVHELDLNTFNSGKMEFYATPYGKALPGQKVNIKVQRNWSTRTENGTTYDFIHKKAKPVYDYQWHEETALEKDVVTNDDGAFSLSFDIKQDEETTGYHVFVHTADEKGRTILEQSYISAGTNDMIQNDNFSLRPKEKASWPLRGSGTENDFSVGEQGGFTFVKDEQEIQEKNTSRFLYIESQGGIKKSTVSDTASYDFTFGEEQIPNVIVQGIWFDGRTYWTTGTSSGWFGSGAVVSFREQDKKMNVDIAADKENYAPGEQVKLDITTAHADGSKGPSIVNLNLIDEAIYALQEEKVDFNAALYSDVPSGIYAAYASHRYPTSLSGAEGGGGGGVRQNFRDKAFFKTVETDKNGKASVTFTLPDNLTSWRVTAHSLDKELFAGNGSGSVVATESFFVDAVISDTYLAGDQPVIQIRTFGSSLTPETGVSLEVSSETLPGEKGSLTTTGFQVIDFPLNKLPEGNHNISIAAKSDKGEDAIKRTFTVIPSRLLVPQVKIESVKNNWKPEIKTDRNFDITFTDNHKGQYYELLQRMTSQLGDRLDEKGVEVIARKLLSQYFSQEQVPQDFPVQYYQTEKGGLTIYPYSDEDLTLSAHIAASSLSEKFDQARLADYFQSILKDKTQTLARQSQALYGLASLKKPVLLLIEDFLASEKISDTDRLYLGLGLARMGKQDEAQKILTTLKEKYGKTKDVYTFLQLGKDKDEYLENTSLAAFLAAVIEDKDADGFFRYVKDNDTKDVLLELPTANFIEARLKTVPQEPVQITYEYLGETKTEKLAEGKVLQLSFTPSSYETFQVKEVQGSSTALVQELVAVSEKELNKEPKLSLKRTFDAKEIKEGDIIKIRLDFNIPAELQDGLYQITDFVPSGLRPVSREYMFSPTQYFPNDYRLPYEIDGQRVSFTASKDEKDKSFFYYARVINKGTFKAEKPFIQSMNAPSIRMGGNEEVITVK